MPDPSKKIIVKIKKKPVADRGDYDELRALAKTGGGSSPKLASSGTPPREVYDNLRASAVQGSGVSNDYKNMGVPKRSDYDQLRALAKTGSGSGKERTIDRATPEEYKATRIMIKKPKK